MTRSGAPGRVFISAGEISGDMHGAALVRGLRSLRPNMEFSGISGPAMREEGVRPGFSVSKLSLVGLTEVLAHLPDVLGMMARVYTFLEQTRPDAVICIDAPDFNFFVVRMARRLEIPVYYYISPQVWAWRRGRVHFLRRKTRKVLCILPFERDFYREHGAEAEYVGHPLLDAMDFDALDTVAPEPNRIGLLPGSRRKEVSSLLPEFMTMGRRLLAERPDTVFSLVRAPGMDESEILSRVPEGFPVEIKESRDRYREMRRCRFLVAASGTVSLEAALLGVPTIVTYKVSPLTYRAGRLVVGVDFVSLPNLILGTEVFPELLQEEADGDSIAVLALRWLASDDLIEGKRRELARLRSRMGEPGAARRAARIILTDLDSLGRS